MRLHRFFVKPSLADLKKIKIADDDLANQWRNVLRYQVGQEVILLDNSGQEFLAVITSLSNREAEVEVVSSRTATFSPKVPVFLFLALSKRDAFEWAIEKGTELGVSGFVPIISEHSEKKTLNLGRTKIIIKESCEQSGRSVLPEIYEPIKLADTTEILSGQSLVLDPKGDAFDRSMFKLQDRVNVFIGPEGGWTKSELEFLDSLGVKSFSLGKQVLRSETAAAAIASLFLL